MPASFFIYGERGIGKTALAKLILHISSTQDKKFHDLNLLTSYYAVEKGQDISSVLEESVNNLTNRMNKNLVERIGSRVGDIFRNGKFKIGAFGASANFGAKDQRQRDITIKDQTVSILTNIIKSLEEKDDKKSLVDKQDGILIVIDEVDNLANLSSVASIIRNIATTLDVESLGRVSFLLVGYEQNVKKFFKQDSSARRIFDLIRLSTMPEEEAMEVLEKGFKAAKLNYDLAAINKNISIAGGYPHSIQMIGHQLIEVDKDDNINQEDWDDAAFKAALILKTKEFSNMYSFGKTNTTKDEILKVLAKENKPMTIKEISAKLPRNKNIYQYIPQLIKNGAIKKDEENMLSLHSQLFRTAISIDTYIKEFDIRSKKTKK
jgi:hypothetical protein